MTVDPKGYILHSLVSIGQYQLVLHFSKQILVISQHMQVLGKAGTVTQINLEVKDYKIGIVMGQKSQQNSETKR